MLLKSFTIAAAGLAAATAFLIPPEISEADSDSITTRPFDAPMIAESHSIKLACPGCPLLLKGRNGRFRVRQGVKNHLQLSFNIDHQPEHDRLLVNGFQMYPNPAIFQSLLLTAPQVADPDEEISAKKLDPASVPLGYTLLSRTLAEEKGMQLIGIDLEVTEVGNTFMTGIPKIHVKLIKTADGALMIGDLKIEQVQPEQSSPMEKQEECTTILCKWRAIVADRLKHVRPHKCGMMGKMGHHNGHHKGQSHHQGHHQGGRPYHLRLHEHSWAKLMKKFGSHILFPIFIGILAGVTASIIGMVVGTVLVGLWRVFVRGQPFFHRRRHSGHSHKAAHREAALAEEKSGLIAYQDVPPTQEDENKTAEA